MRGTVPPPVHINVCDLFYTSTSGTAGSEAASSLSICTSGDLIGDEWEIARGCVYYPNEGDILARCCFFFFFFFPLSSGVVLMDNDKNVFVSVPAGSGEIGIGGVLVCETEL